MRAVVLDVPDKWLREREAAGLDRSDGPGLRVTWAGGERTI